MPKFNWEGKTKAGALQKGVMEAANESMVESQLKKYGFSNITIKGEKAGFKIPGFGGGGAKVDTKDLVVFTRQFATMIDSGLPLVQCLDILASQQLNKSFKAALYAIKEAVESGSTFADALGKHPRIFDQLYVNLIAAGEVGGILDTILNRLAAYIEKALKLKKQVKGAMVYPATIISIAVVVIGVILVFVIPTFAKMFADFGGTLPMPTLIVISISNFLQRYILVIIAVFYGIKVAIGKYYATPSGRKLMDTLFLKLPVVGVLIRKVSVAKFTRTLGTMISSGDSIWISSVAKVSDLNGAIQENIKNRRVTMSIVWPPANWKVAIGPNPFKPGETVIPDNIQDRGKGFGTVIRIKPTSSVDIEKVDVKCRVYDLLGNMLFEKKCNRQGDSYYVVWDGSNKNYRFVGAGTYKVFAVIDGEAIIPAANLGVKR